MIYIANKDFHGNGVLYQQGQRLALDDSIAAPWLRDGVIEPFVELPAIEVEPEAEPELQLKPVAKPKRKRRRHV